MTGSFLTRLRGWRSDGTMPIIAEIKPSTPEHGDLLRGRRIECIVMAYEAAGAACISVVTGRWFGGSAPLLEQVAATTKLPILQKDFIVTAAAMARSAAMGASAVLLTSTVITRQALVRLVDEALGLGLTPFVELASPAELRDLELPPGAIAAVNNKDIRAKERSGDGVSRSFELLAMAKATGAGATVSASGIASPAMARSLLAAGYDGLLVGTAVLRAENLASTLAQFRSEIVDAGVRGAIA
jgi:indole-3-glycerol phosphate synthase